jgi:hypothetical protein
MHMTHDIEQSPTFNGAAAGGTLRAAVRDDRKGRAQDQGCTRMKDVFYCADVEFEEVVLRDPPHWVQPIALALVLVSLAIA